MKKYIPQSIITAALFAAPVMVLAQSSTPNRTLKDLACTAAGYFALVAYLIIGLAVVVFIWNVYRYFILADSTGRKEAGAYILYSVVGFFIILSLWGLVNLVTNSLNLESAPSSSWSVLPDGSTCGSGGTSLPTAGATNGTILPVAGQTTTF